MIKHLFDFFKQLFFKIFREKKQQAQWPKIVIPPPKPKEEIKSNAPKAKEFIRPDDPDFRYGSSYLINLRKQRGLTEPITKNRPRKIV